MAIFRRSAYQPLSIVGINQARLPPVDISKSDAKVAAGMVNDVLSNYHDDDYDRVFRAQRAQIGAVEAVLCDRSTCDEHKVELARCFALGWFLGNVERLRKLAKDRLASEPAVFAMVMLRVYVREAFGPDLRFADNAVEAGYFANRSGADPEILSDSLRNGAVLEASHPS